METTLYKIPSSEIPLLLSQLETAYYWRPSSNLLHWNGGWQRTDIEVGDDPLTTLPQLPLTGTVVINGLLDDGISSKIMHQIIDAHFQSVEQHWVIIFVRGDIPPDLAPFVQVKTWPLPNSTEIARLLLEHNLYNVRLLRSCLGLYEQELKMLLSREEPLREILDYKRRKLQSRGIQHIPEPDCDAVGCDNILNLIDQVGRLLTPEAEAAGLPFPKGMILLGIPGSGKSLAAKTAAKRLGVPLICADWGGLISSEPGQSEENVKTLLQTAEVSAPCILFFDDFDKAFASADLSQENSAEKRIAGYLLTWLQERTAQVFCIVTCNRIAQLPPELKRRFDWHVNVDLPHEGSRYEIFQIHLKKYCGAVPQWNVYEWKKLISAYNESTPDEIGKAVHKAAIAAFERGEPRNITVEDLLEQRRQFTPANLANPEQIETIRRHSRHAMPAASPDKSEFRVEPVEVFSRILGQ
jgi:hypothetical protein